MITPEILNYIKQQIASGVSRDQIVVSLKQNGWNDSDLSEAFNAVNGSVNTVPQPPRVEQSHILRNSTVVVVVLAVLVGGGWFFLQNKSNSSVNQGIQNEVVNPVTEVQAPKTENFDDLKISYVAVPTEKNSASVFNTIPPNSIIKTDQDLLDKYFKNYPPISSIPLAESKKILAKYGDIFEAFESGTSKEYYQCSVVMGDDCSLNILRNISKLAVLKSFVLLKEGKVVDAENYAQKVVKLGQMLSAQSDEFITLLVAWEMQKMGYYALQEIKPASKLSAVDKSVLIDSLRAEHKKVFQFDYTRHLETIDYITDVNKKPSGVIDQETENFFDEYRKVANSVTWKPDTVRQWFYDSFKVALANVDLPCGSTYKDTQVDIEFNPEETSQTENYVGKTLYSSTYASLGTSSLKRCEVEDRINSL